MLHTASDFRRVSKGHLHQLKSQLLCFIEQQGGLREGQEGRRGLQFRFYSAFSPGSLCTLFLVLALPKKVLGMAVAGTTSDPRLP